MCVTIEPGIYFVPAIWKSEELVKPLSDVINRKNIDRLLNEQFGGIRIEESVHVTDNQEPEILTSELPSDPDSITQLMNS